MSARSDTSLPPLVTAVEGAARDCEAILQACTPPVARLSGCRHILAEQLGWDMTGRGWAAELLGFLLAHRAGPATWLVHRLTGERPEIETIEGSEQEYRLPGGELDSLAVLDEAGLYGWERRGLMLAGTTVAAEVRLRLVPARLPGGWDGDDFAMIRKGVPCGEVIPGLTRTCRRGRVHWPEDPSATGAAVLTRPDGTAFGFANERFSRGLCARLAGLNLRNVVT